MPKSSPRKCLPPLSTWNLIPDLSFDEKKEVYRISNKIVRTMNVTQSAVGDKRGLWTTVLGAAILIGEDD